jgi:hypothetical protein
LALVSREPLLRVAIIEAARTGRSVAVIRWLVISSVIDHSRGEKLRLGMTIP